MKTNVLKNLSKKMNPYPPDFCKKGKIAGKRPLIFSTPAAPGSKKPITPIPPQFTPIRSDDPGKHVESPYFNQLGILVRSSAENKIMSQNPPPPRAL